MKIVELRVNSKYIDLFKRLIKSLNNSNSAKELIEASREFAFAYNKTTNSKIGGSLIFSLSLIVRIIDNLFEFYSKNRDDFFLKKSFDYSVKNFGAREFISLLDNFIKTFPPDEISEKKLNVEEYIWQRKNSKYNYEKEIAQTILAFLLNENPALEQIADLFDIRKTNFSREFNNYVKTIDEFFRNEPPVVKSKSLIEFLLEPIKKFPNNLQAQLEFIKTNWSEIIGDEFLQEILIAKDLFKEDVIKHAIDFTPQTIVPQYKIKSDSSQHGGSEYAETIEEYEAEENFTPDTDWMPNVVMIAKNTYVWLDQLSKKYQREIKRLDQIPDEELQLLASYNINSLWLIGVWERSEASRKIKHLRGNTDAVASAYSLYDYEIAHDLGGEDAYRNLNERAKKYGIRLAADMVPNHTGIYSKWITEHPDYFIQTNKPPFPNYSFTGENLSPDPNFTIRIEDGYWTNTDAAVVFQFIDNRTGEMRFIYHGNDGTSMPWNDTAQLDILKEEVREAVIQKIMEVARKFSIIRFDAAMTLTKKHFARLWYPEPGKGGDIPSRTEFSMTKEQFNKFFPKEFWREVVDRINDEMPDTLLLAEAFWLMEGYFVRTLGMHRVYNSAFMNMLMREENAKYRELIKNTLEFEPGILKRYVNFMSNPDEETAIKQFGTGDKYFGVLTLMVTLPGLPMFAHGQIEGFTEKYGMEYKRAYYDEKPNYELIERHKHEIFPLLAKRKLFSEADNFWFFDFIENNEVNENVFAYVNTWGNDKALVFYNNKYSRANGFIKNSTPKLKNGRLVTTNIIDALNLPYDDDLIITSFEQISKLNFVFKIKDFKNGFNIHLNGFEYRVFTDFNIVTENKDIYENLYHTLNKQGVVSLEKEISKIEIKPLHDAVYKIFEDNTIDILVEYFDNEGITKEDEINKKLKFLINKFNYLLNYAIYFTGTNVELSEFPQEFEETFSALQILRKDLMLEKFELDKTLHKSLLLFFEHNYRMNLVILILIFIKKAFIKIETEGGKEDFIENIVFPEICADVIRQTGKSESEITEFKTLIDILVEYTESKLRIFTKDVFPNKFSAIEKLLSNNKTREFLKINKYEGITYYRKENLEELFDWFFTLDVIFEYVKFNKSQSTLNERTKFLKDALSKINKIKITSDDSGYKLNKFFELLKKYEK